ncbi:MAG: roadblock/LC7 domain-containing protein [Desulfuromonas sp.]|nr:roadblock/LC7 domain-containing protein [Desulfuromonas sp.]
MPFKSVLSQMLDADLGVCGAIIADWDGEAVDWLSSGRCDEDLKIFAAHQGILLRQFRGMVSGSRAGRVKEVIIRTSKVDWFVFPITSEYYLALSAQCGGLNSQLSIVGQRCVRELRKEIDEA